MVTWHFHKRERGRTPGRLVSGSADVLITFSQDLLEWMRWREVWAQGGGWRARHRRVRVKSTCLALEHEEDRVGPESRGQSEAEAETLAAQSRRQCLSHRWIPEALPRSDWRRQIGDKAAISALT